MLPTMMDTSFGNAPFLPFWNSVEVLSLFFYTARSHQVAQMYALAWLASLLDCSPNWFSLDCGG